MAFAFILLEWENPAFSHSTYDFGKNEHLELSEDCSIPGPSVATLSAVIEHRTTGNIIDSPVPAKVKQVIAAETDSFLCYRRQTNSRS